jgi:hypothetical protein
MSAKLGAAASKSSLAAAARGQVLPSWETTWEFVRALAVVRLELDPEETEREWRERWEKTRIATLGGTDLLQADATLADRGEAAEGVAATTEHVKSDGDFPHRARNLKKMAGVAALTTIIAGGGGAVAVAVLASSPDRIGKEAPKPTSPPSTAVQARDDAAFEADVTYPDGTVVDTGERFTKTWRIRNTGVVAWRGRYLTRINSTACDAPEMVPIRSTDPGEAVEISVKVRAASGPAHCKIYWKMTDASRTPLLAEKRPIFLDVQVKKL